MQAFICTTCGVQYEPSDIAPANCPVCEDDRQYVNPFGQSWSTLERLNQQHKNIIESITPDIYAIYTVPSFAIGQRAHLIVSPAGNILWDCITNLDQSTKILIEALGGIKAIAISHPHYFSTIVEWSKAFGDAPVYVHKLDEVWLGRRSPAIQLWQDDELPLWDEMKLIRCGGHFPGACILHHPHNRSLFTGDVIQVTPDLATVSFMYSYPNMIPLPKKDILQIQRCVADLEYETIYGAFGRYIQSNAKASIEFSINRYLRIFD